VPGVRGEGVKKKRWTIKIALCLLAGAVVTWGVAWGCAIGAHLIPWGPFVLVAMKDGEVVTGYCDRSFGAEVWVVSSTRVADKAPLLQAPSWVQPAEPSPLVNVAFAINGTFGWPMGALRGGSDAQGPSKAVEVPISGETYRLPATFAVLGFALNTLFYAAVLLGVVECVAFARRRVRRGKGRCPSCGYDRAGLAEGSACPECGGKA
jgi:hypothetical protein